MSQILNFKGDYNGLTTAQAEENLKMYGSNDDRISPQPPYSLKKAILTPRFFAQAVAAILLFAAGQFTLGAVMLLLTVMLTAGDAIWQLRLFERQELVKKLAGMKFRVIRDGELTLIRKENIVPDDIIVLQGGERVPADAHLLESEDLTVDESLITGDSSPAVKRPGADSGNALPKSTCIYKNTLILSGSLIARVFATGEDAVIKRHETRTGSRIEESLKKPSRIMCIVGLAAAVITAFVCFLRAGEITDYIQVLTQIVLPAVSVGICFIPSQADKLVRLIYLDGASSMSRHHALVKNIGTVEQLSAITCICVEKTGTVTKSHIEVADVFTENNRLFTNVCVLACEPTPTLAEEKAILLYAAFGGADSKELFSNRRIASYPFTENAKMAGNLWEINGQKLLCIKGSPEEILALCEIEPDEIHYIQQKRQSYTKQGRQVLAVAYATLAPQDAAPEKLSDIRYEYIGLVALENTTRDTVPYAVKSCIRSGVRVIMITGDNEEAAAAVGRQIGLQSTQTVTGAELEEYSGEGPFPDLDKVGIFARVTPQQRLQVVKMLKDSGETVAMVGTGSDDVELLEESDVGIASSSSSTPAACESCDLLMGDDNFLAVADAIKESRQIHRNIKSALNLLLSAHAALAIFAVVAVAVGGAVLSLPILPALLSFVVFPVAASTLVGNTGDLRSDFISSGYIRKGIMNKGFFLRSFIMGGTLAIAITLFYLFTLELDPAVQRAVLLMMMTVGTVLQGFTLTSRRRTFVSVMKDKNSSFAGMLQAGIMFLVSLVLIYVPFLNRLFSFEPPDLLLLLIALVITFLFTFWREVQKKFTE